MYTPREARRRIYHCYTPGKLEEAREPLIHTGRYTRVVYARYTMVGIPGGICQGVLAVHRVYLGCTSGA